MTTRPPARATATRGVWLTSPDYPAALADADKAIALDPKSAVFYAERGALKMRALAAEGGLIGSKTTSAQRDAAAKSAEADFTQAIALDPNTPGVYTGRAQARARLHAAPALILADGEKALAADSKDVAALGVVVETASATGDWARAKTAADAYITMLPSGAAYLARARFNLKAPDGALADATFVVDRDPSASERADALILRGQIYAAQGKAALKK